MNFDRMQKLAGVKELQIAKAEDENYLDDVPTVTIKIVDEETAPKMLIDIGCMFHDQGNGKIALLSQDAQLQAELVLALQKNIQECFRTTVHSLLGEPYGIPE